MIFRLVWLSPHILNTIFITYLESSPFVLRPQVDQIKYLTMILVLAPYQEHAKLLLIRSKVFVQKVPPTI